MRVTMLATAAGPDGVLLSGQSYDVDNALGDALVRGGFAVMQPGLPQSGPRAEVATIAPPETADVRPNAPRRRGSAV